MTNDKPVLIYATFPTTEEAEHAAATLIEAKLAACVNILPGMRSVYRWQGAVETADEVSALIKTRQNLSDQAVAHIRECHSYDTPAILVVPVTSGEPAFLQWIMSETEQASEKQSH